eukprot:Em0008g83a
MQLLRTLFLVAAQHSFTIRLSHLPGRLNSIADAISFATDQSLGPIYHNHLRHRCQTLPGFLPCLQLIPVPGTKEAITLFAAHLSQSMNPRTIQVYVAAVCFLHHSLGYKSSASRNLMLRLAIRGFQRLQGHSPQAHTTATDSGNAGSHPEKKHDRLMLPTFGFFGFWKVSKFTVKNRTFDPRFHPTSRDISWSREGIHFFIKQSKTDQMGKGTTICIGRTEGRHTCPVAAMERWEATNIQELSSYPWWINAAMIQPNTTPTVYVLVQPQQLPDWTFPLTPFRSSEDGEAKPTRHIPVIP